LNIEQRTILSETVLGTIIHYTRKVF
jgi:hypothetical protein